MTLPSSGPLTLADIQGEFGGSNPISLSEYYAGGGLVPSGTTGTYGAVPSSGTISIQNFYGTSNVTISVSSQTIQASSFSSAHAYYYLTGSGQTQQSTSAGGVNPITIEQWCAPANQAPNYEVEVTIVSGALSGGSSVGAWVPLSSTQSWYIEEFIPGNINTCVFTVEIRKIGTTTVLDSANITLTALMN